MSNLTPNQWKLYKYLKDNAVGSINVKSGDTICEALGYKNKPTLQADIRELRINMRRKIASNNKGYYLPINARDDSYFVASQVYGRIYTALLDGSITKEQLHGFIQSVNVELPLDNQLKLTFTKYQENEVNVYSHDLLEKTPEQELQAILSLVDRGEQYDRAKALYKKLGGYPINLSTDEYIEEIKEMLRNDK